MARGRRTSIKITLAPRSQRELEAWHRSTAIPAGLARRARLILLLAQGASISDTARTIGMERRHVYKWADRFACQGTAGLRDKPGRGGRRTPVTGS